MGGKTQQRVAGNAKPANSGRIRELLITRQVGAANPGNIITFSVLSNNKSTVKSAPKPGLEANPSDDLPSSMDAKCFDRSINQNQPSIVSENCHVQSTSNKDSYKLVVKRVGNRDLYTRVRLSEEVELSDGTTKPAVHPSEAGVKKPPVSLDDPLASFNDSMNSEDKLDGDESEEEEFTPDESDKETSDEFEGDFDETLARLSQLQEETNLSVACDSIVIMSDHQLEKELELLRLLKTAIRRFSRDLSLEDWDLIAESLKKWIGWISRAEHPFKEMRDANFSAKVFDFVYSLIEFAEEIKTQEESVGEFALMQSLLDDWANFHSSNMFQDLLVLFFKLISLENMNSASEIVRPMIASLAQIIIDVDPRLVLSHYSLHDNLSSKVELDLDFEAPKDAIYCDVDERKFRSFLAVCGLLRSNFRVILVSAHAMLSKTLNAICESALKALNTIQYDQEQVVDEDIPIFPPVALMSILTSRDAMVGALLSDFRVGDVSVTIEHNTDAYACTLSYLFAWDLVIQFIVCVDKEIGHKIIHSLKKIGLIQRLLDNIFMLLPPLGQQDSLRFRIYKSDPRSNQKDLLPASGVQKSWNLESFLKSPLRTTVKRPLNEIELIALHLYFSVALHMPVTVRKWYNNNSNKRLCNLVQEYTVKHISRIICSLEMESVQEKCIERASQNELTNLTIKARPSAKEVLAIYHRDEFKMELTIKLPNNYPLGPVQIDGGKRVGVTDVKWRSWLLQLTTFLAHQNGPILDGIDLWRRNIDKRFEGVEKCTICFSILHSNYQLPKKKCQTCANMFHNLCLFKWFESSGNSTCPLCRNPW